MLTQRGWGTAGAGTALALLWFLLGEPELGVAALLLLTAVVAALVWIRRGQPHVEIRRHTSPTAVHDGDHASVTLHITNEGVPLRQLTVTDEVAGLGTAEFATASLPRNATYRATYRVLCRPRGVYPIGPTGLTVSDPLGLAFLSTKAGRVDTLVVYPAVEDLTELPEVLGRNMAIRAHRPEHSQRGGEDFYTLREYQQGDDLRRIHWPSSARHDRLMIRQLEIPWQARSLVILDVRAEAYSNPSAFEAAVSGAASVIHHLMNNAFDTQVWMGGPTVTVSTGSGYAVAMERLAQVKTQEGLELAAAASRLRYQGGGGMLVMATGSPDASLLGLARVLAPEYPTAAILVADNGAASSVTDFQRAGILTVTLDSAGGWAPSWNRAMRTTWHAVSAGS